MANSTFHLFLEEISRKAGITELIINRPDSVFVEREGELIKIDVRFSEEEIDNFCQEVALFNHKEFSEEIPILDGNLSDGSRINLLHKNYTHTGHAITIRRYSKSIKSFDSTPNIFGLSPEWIQFLKTLVKARKNVVVSGGTGVGKTTFLNLMLQELPKKERLITIEDTRELQVQLSNVVRLEARPPLHHLNGLSIRDLLKNTLRMRPDRIIVGEVRGGEVFDLLQAMNTGHEGSMTSLHANSPGECLSRLENLFLLSGHDLPMRALRYQISTAVDFIVQLKRNRSGQRIVHQISEVSGMEGDRITMQDIGQYRETHLHFTGMVPASVEKLQEAGLPIDFFAQT